MAFGKSTLCSSESNFLSIWRSHFFVTLVLELQLLGQASRLPSFSIGTIDVCNRSQSFRLQFRLQSSSIRTFRLQPLPTGRTRVSVELQSASIGTIDAHWNAIVPNRSDCSRHQPERLRSLPSRTIGVPVAIVANRNDWRLDCNRSQSFRL